MACSSGLDNDHGLIIEGNISDVKYSITAGDKLRVDVDWAEATSTANLTVAELEETGLSELFEGVASAWDVWCNVSGKLECNSPSGGCTTGAEAACTPDSPDPQSTSDDNKVCTETTVGSWGPGKRFRVGK